MFLQILKHDLTSFGLVFLGGLSGGGVEGFAPTNPSRPIWSFGGKRVCCADPMTNICEGVKSVALQLISKVQVPPLLTTTFLLLGGRFSGWFLVGLGGGLGGVIGEVFRRFLEGF